MMTLSMMASSPMTKAPHCYHLVTVKSASRLQLFAATRALRALQTPAARRVDICS
jgi:hypothetical protein